MCTLTSLLEQLNPIQQQAVIDILATVQEKKHLSRKQLGLVGCSVNLFPVEEIKKLFSRNPVLRIAANRLLAEQGYVNHGCINLMNFLSTMMETEVERRINIMNEKTLFDLAEDTEE